MTPYTPEQQVRLDKFLAKSALGLSFVIVGANIPLKERAQRLSNAHRLAQISLHKTCLAILVGGSLFGCYSLIHIPALQANASAVLAVTALFVLIFATSHVRWH